MKSPPLNPPKDRIIYSSGDNHLVREVDLGSGTLTTLGGDLDMDPIEGTFSGDEGQALEARMAQPRGVEVVGDTVYVADRDNKSVRRIKDGKMTSVAGGCDGFYRE